MSATVAPRRGAPARILDWYGASQERSYRLLTRAAALVRLPTSPRAAPDVLPDGAGLRCPATGRVYPYRDGVLDLLAPDAALTAAQKVLTSPANAWAYDRFRGALLRLLGGPSFSKEISAIQKRLNVEPGDRVLDLACGHGNFTVEWGRRAGPAGLVLGLDISAAMLARAAVRVAHAGLDNVLLIRGDALNLPLADRCVAKVNCSGGFHQFPDLRRAVREIGRVSTPGAALTASTLAEGPNDPYARAKRWLKRRFAVHCVPFDWLGEELAAAGYGAYRWSLPGGGFGYASAARTAAG